MTFERAMEIVREFWPGWDEEYLRNILIDYTGYPYFWGEKDKEKCLRDELKEYLEK